VLLRLEGCSGLMLWLVVLQKVPGTLTETVATVAMIGLLSFTMKSVTYTHIIIGNRYYH
jgi:hypothetical protein